MLFMNISLSLMNESIMFMNIPLYLMNMFNDIYEYFIILNEYIQCYS